MKKEKITIRVLIENDRSYLEEYNTNQKIQVIVNKALANLGITADDRQLRREDGTPITDFNVTIEDLGIYDNETLRFIKKAPKPDRDKGFAFSGDWRSTPSYKNLHESEMGALKNGLGGDFQLIEILPESVTDGRLACIGSLKVNDQVSEYILIVFPVHYPYAAPRVTVGTYDPAKGHASFAPKHFGKGNQYSDFSLCLMQKNAWNFSEHNVGWLLRRTQKWLTGAHRPEGFLKTEIVEEFPALMQHVGQVLFCGQIASSPEARTGNIQLTQFKPHHYIVEQNALQTSPFTLNVGIEPFKWYKFEKVKFNDMVKQPQDVITCIQKAFGEFLADGQNRNFAIYLPDDSQQWHFFKIIRGQILYMIGRDLSKELFVRSAGIFNSSELKVKRVTIIGLGALGSEVALALAKNGVGVFNLIDIESVEVGNVIRHAADLFYVGDRKVTAARQLIQRINPLAIVNPFEVDVLDDNVIVEQLLSKSDLCIVLTAEDSVDYMINDRMASKYNIPFIFARVSKGAYSGSIQVVKVGETACLRCLSAAGYDTLPEPSKKVELAELTAEYGGCSNPATPGSEIDSMEIALQVSRISLQLLSPSNEAYPARQGDQYYWNGPFGTKEYAPYSWQITAHKKNSNCKVCGRQN